MEDSPPTSSRRRDEDEYERYIDVANRSQLDEKVE